MIVNQFSPALRIVGASDLILTVPERIVAAQDDRYDLHVTRCPVKAPESFSATSVVWHHRLGVHPALDWLRDVLGNVAADGRRRDRGSPSS